MIFLRQIWIIFHKDVCVEWRTKERLTPMVLYSFIIILLFNFSMDLRIININGIGSGILWSTLVLANLLGLNRSFGNEQENRAIDALIIAPVDYGAIYLGKMFAHLLSLLLVALIILPFFNLFFNIPISRNFSPISGLLILGSLCLSTVGILFAATFSNLRLRETLLPVLLLPMLLPPLISCVEATKIVFNGNSSVALWDHVKMLFAYAIIFTTLSIMLFENAIEE